MKSPVIIVCLSMFFGQAISLVGGLDFLVNGIIDTFGFGWYALLVVVAVLYFVMCIFVGNSIAIPVCVPIVVAAMIALGMESQLAMAALILTFVGGLGKSLTPYDPSSCTSELCGNYNTMDLVKRNSVPIVFAFVLSLVLSIVMYGVMAVAGSCGRGLPLWPCSKESRISRDVRNMRGRRFNGQVSKRDKRRALPRRMAVAGGRPDRHAQHAVVGSRLPQRLRRSFTTPTRTATW